MRNSSGGRVVPGLDQERGTLLGPLAKQFVVEVADKTITGEVLAQHGLGEREGAVAVLIGEPWARPGSDAHPTKSILGLGPRYL